MVLSHSLLVLPIHTCGPFPSHLVFPNRCKEYQWSFPSNIGLSLLGVQSVNGSFHCLLVFPYGYKRYQWSFPYIHAGLSLPTWSFPIGVKSTNGPSHPTLVCPYRCTKCQWFFPIPSWSFPMGIKDINGPSHTYMRAFPVPPGLSL